MKHLATREITILETIPTERSELETEKKILQQELQTLIKKRKEIQISQSIPSLSQRRNENIKPSILSPRRFKIFKMSHQRKRKQPNSHPTFSNNEGNHLKQKDELTNPRNKNRQNILQEDQKVTENKIISNNFKSRSINNKEFSIKQKEDSISNKENSINQRDKSLIDCSLGNPDYYGYLNKNEILKELAKTKERQKKLVDNFILMNKIGIGSFGKVFKVQRKSTNEILAAKISINKLDDVSDNDLLNITREVNIMVKLNFPSILRFEFFSPVDFKGKRKAVIITEYAVNESLGKVIELERSDPTKTILNSTNKLIIIYGIASAMSYLHSHNIIHRDLKPDNILLDEYLFPKVADFGLSKVNHKNEQSMTMKSIFELKGTPIYTSPEIFRSYEYTKKGDVYAFAIIVYELMTNLKPFEDLNIFLLQMKVMNGYRPDIGNQIPESYVKLIQDCWSQESSKRPTFEEIMERLLKDRGFITETVNESDFMKYVKYIKEYKSSFDQTKNIFYRDLQNNFSIVDIKEKGEDKINMIINSSSLFPYKEYMKLDELSKKVVDEVGEDPSKQFNIGISLIEGRELFSRNAQIGLKYLKKSIEKDFLESIIYYCEMFIKGKIIPQDLDKARKIADKKLRNHESEYLMILGKISRKKNKYEDSIKYFLKSIEGSNSESMYSYAKMLYKGEGQLLNKEKSLEYFRRAIDKGHVKSMFRYGRIMKEDLSNNEEGNQYIKKSADFGYNKACYYYSMILDKGDGIEINKEESKQYLREGARLGHIESMFKYGLELLDDPKTGEEPVLYFKKSIEEGHIESMYRYGMMFHSGEGVEQNKKEAAKYLRMSAYSGNAKSMAFYGFILQHGDGIPIDKEEAVKLFQRGSELGNDAAMNNYAYSLHVGNGVPVNKEEAIKYYKMAIEKGNSAAMVNYADMLRIGDHVPANKEEAIKYYKMAIEQGNKFAISKYTQMLQYEEDAETEREQMVSTLKKAIERGDSDAMNKYAVMLYGGRGIPVNKEEAFKYFKMSADRGNIQAMVNYAIFLSMHGENPLDKEESNKYFKLAIEKGNSTAMARYADVLLSKKENEDNKEMQKENAIKYYKMAINKGNAEAMDKYANALYYGRYGIPVDKQEALKYFKMAADRGNANANNKLANILYHENGSVANDEIMKYYKKAAEEGSVSSMKKYGEIIFNGDGVTADKKEGLKYFHMAAEKGDADAMCKYGEILLRGEVIPQKEEEGIKYIKLSSEKGSSRGMFLYGCLLEEGKYVEHDKEKSIQYFIKSSNEGNLEAIRHYNKILDEEEQNYKSEEDNPPQKRKIKRRRSFSFISKEKSSLFVKLDETCRQSFVDCEFCDLSSLFYVAVSLIEGKNNFPKNKTIGKEYLERSVKNKNVESIKYYSQNICETKSHFILNEISSIHESSNIKINLTKDILSRETFDIETSTKDRNINYELAKELSKESSDMGNLRGMLIYGQLCMKNKKNFVSEIRSNFKESFKCIECSAKGGDSEAMYLYGYFLEYGIGCTHKNAVKVVKYYKKSCDRGNLSGCALYDCSLIDETGGLEKDVKEGLRLIKYSFDHNDPIGIHLYACYLYQGLPNLEKDFELSFKYWKLAARMGYSTAINNVGACYQDGEGTEIDTKEAIKYYLRGIEEGSISSARNLGLLLIEGDLANGIEPDFKEGMKYLKYASENGDTDAMLYYSRNTANKEIT